MPTTPTDRKTLVTALLALPAQKKEMLRRVFALTDDQQTRLLATLVTSLWDQDCDALTYLIDRAEEEA